MVPTQNNSLPTVNIVASTPSVEVITPSVEKSNALTETNNSPAEKTEPKPVELKPIESVSLPVIPKPSPQIDTQPNPQPSPKPDEIKVEPKVESKGNLKLRDINSVRAVLDEIYELWRINLMEKLAANPTKAHLEEHAKRTMQKLLFENTMNELTDNVNLNSLELVYNRICGALESRSFPMVRMISKEHFCYERTD
jgi:hypothetical protein